LARYKDSVCRLCRNEGRKLFLKATRCDTPKCAFERRPFPTGPHGQARKKLSEYAYQLREKQKVRRLYGLLEKQFRRNFDVATHKKGVTGTLMFQRLESRLDNVVYRSGLGGSRPQSRQLIRHGHFLVNGRKVDIPSFILKPGDTITVRPKSKATIQAVIEGKRPVVPHWMTMDENALTITYNALPEREDLDPTLKEQLIIEYYSR
jgi:small subunit ribosomal protein S4